MIVSLIVAMSENGVIGHDGDMPWRLSADLRRFKKLTMGHHMIMGRKTFESIGRLLPGRTTIIVTRNPEYKMPGALVSHSIESAIEMAGGDEQVFVVGGGEIYRLALRLATRIYLTRVHTELIGDTTFPKVEWDRWENIETARHESDEKNQFDYSFEDYRRKS